MVEFPATTDEGVPLTEDILKKPREFVRTWLEWIADGNAEQVGKSGNITRGATGVQTLTIYTVPDNFTLFITSVWMGMDNTAIGSGTASGSLRLLGPFINLMSDNLNLGHAHGSHSSNSFTMPFKVESKGKVAINIEMVSTGAPTSVTTHGGFLGFLLPKKISFR